MKKIKSVTDGNPWHGSHGRLHLEKERERAREFSYWSTAAHAKVVALTTLHRTENVVAFPTQSHF